MDSNIPLLPEGFTPGCWQVICHRGKEAYHHEGNCRFRQHVEELLDEYVASMSRQDKSVIIQKITRRVHQRSAMLGYPNDIGFVKRNPMTNRWEVLDPSAVKQKVSQALRDVLKVRKANFLPVAAKATRKSAPVKRQKSSKFTTERRQPEHKRRHSLTPVQPKPVRRHSLDLFQTTEDKSWATLPLDGDIDSIFEDDDHLFTDPFSSNVKPTQTTSLDDIFEDDNHLFAGSAIKLDHSARDDDYSNGLCGQMNKLSRLGMDLTSSTFLVASIPFDLDDTTAV